MMMKMTMRRMMRMKRKRKKRVGTSLICDNVKNKLIICDNIH